MYVNLSTRALKSCITTNGNVGYVIRKAANFMHVFIYVYQVVDPVAWMHYSFTF